MKKSSGAGTRTPGSAAGKGKAGSGGSGQSAAEKLVQGIRDQIEYLNKEHVEPNGSSMSLVVRNAVDIFIEKEKKQKLTILKKVLGEEVYEKLLQLSNNYGKEIEATMIDLVELNCQTETKQEEVIDDQWK